MSSSNLQIILKELKQLDYSSYLCATFALRDDLEKISAILLLQGELKKITDIASEDMIGMIRIAWWEENLADIFLHKKNKNHHLLQVIDDLKDEIDYALLSQALEGFREDFAIEKKFKNKDQLEVYIFKTRTVFFLIILRILNFKDKVLSKELANNLALISFYFDLLKSIKNEDEKVAKFFYDGFFSELKIDTKFWQKNNVEKKYDENLLVIVKYVAEQINQACKKIKKIEKLLPKNLKNLVIKKDLAEILLADLHKKNFDIFSSDLVGKSFKVKVGLLLKCF